MSQNSRQTGSTTAEERIAGPVNSARGLVGRRRIPTYVWFLLPGLVLYLMFFIGPMFAAFRLSLTNWPGIGHTMDFVGLRNFGDVLTDYQVWRSLLHNLYFFILIFVLQNTVG